MRNLNLQHLPARSGTYLFRDAGGRPLYIGKARDIRERVLAHLRRPGNFKDEILAAETHEVEFVLTDSESEALLLENNLIKRWRPRYNIRLRDDKTYPYIKVTWGEDFPKVLVTRRLQEDGGRYFGPYSDVGAARRTVKDLRKVFPVRVCKQRVAWGKKTRVCLDYHLKRCVGPCWGTVSTEIYRRIVEEFCSFLGGKHTELLDRLSEEMREASADRAYERAAKIRDQIRTFQRTLETRTVQTVRGGDHDVLGLARSGPEALCLVLTVRSGRLIGRDRFEMLCDVRDSDDQILSSFIQQHYAVSSGIPQEILVPVALPEVEPLKAWLATKAGHPVRIHRPSQLERLRLLRLAMKNAHVELKDVLHKLDAASTPVALLKESLHLQKRPDRIDGFDISQIQGSFAVGSCVVFEGGVPNKTRYRHFRIKTVGGQDDFAMMAEVIRRRYHRALEENDSLPDLVLVDGGRGQLAAAEGALRDLGLSKTPLLALAKREETVFLPRLRQGVSLARDSLGLQLLQRVRDEAHRFAVSYHRKIRGKGALRSALNEVPGLGPARRGKLLLEFGSVERIRQAPVEQLTHVEGVGQRMAQRIHDALVA